MKATGRITVLGTALLMMGTGNVLAGEIGPDAYGYRATDGVPFAWEEISSTGTPTLYGSDDGTSSASLGFTFYGTDYTQAYWSPNGLMTFGGPSGQFSNENLSTSDGPSNRPCIAVLWDDWDSNDSGSGVYYETQGATGNRRFVLQWQRLDGYSSSPSTVTFQAILFEGSNNILLQYLDTYSASYRDYGASATVGIRDTDGHLNGENLQWSYNTGVIPNGQAILYVPEPGTLTLLALGSYLASCRRRRRLVGG